MEIWDKFIEQESKKEYFINIFKYLETEEYFPKKDEIFNAFKLCKYEDVKVVIFGQDPYHNIGQAHGLAFSVLNNIAPPSLKNVFKEIYNDLGKTRTNPNLTDWAKQGVLLLNNTLTVRCHQANSHKNIGWETFTNNVIEMLNKKEEKIVFILWGNNAISKEKLISNKHYILKSAHPSPLSAYNGFFGSKVFSKTNELLKKLNYKEIKWED